MIESRRSSCGIMQLPPAEESDTSLPARFEAALQALCGDWLRAYPDAPLLACGMVGSAQGWREARYHPVPCAIEQVA